MKKFLFLTIILFLLVFPAYPGAEEPSGKIVGTIVLPDETAPVALPGLDRQLYFYVPFGAGDGGAVGAGSGGDVGGGPAGGWNPRPKTTHPAKINTSKNRVTCDYFFTIFSKMVSYKKVRLVA